MTRFHRVRPRVRTLFAFAIACLLPALTSIGAGAAQDPAYTVPYPDSDRPSTYSAADWSDDIPAHLAVVDGAAQLERDGALETAEENTPLLAGDRLRTDRGRVEVLFSDGSTLDIDEFSSVDLLSDSLLRLASGRIRLGIARTTSGAEYRIDSVGTTIWIRASGEYRITVMDSRAIDPEVRVTVLRGLAELTSPFGRTLVRAGSEARTTARTEPSLPYVVTAASWDDFERWVNAERDYRLGARSAQYLPAELRYYGGAFDRYGSWEYDRGYGYVWYPRVAVDWQPYYDGRWSFFGSFGWTWIGAGRWTWPTHHYGRWGFSTNRWFWIPDRRWAPAWVYWASAPGYVSWCPLGFDNRPVISITNITFRDSWSRRGWTVVPSRNFGQNVAVPRYANALRTASFPAGTQFAGRVEAPVRPAVIREDLRPLRAPTAQPRSSAVAPSTARSIETNPGPIASPARTAGPARTSESGFRSSPTASPVDQGRPSNSRVARPRVDEQRDATSTQRSVNPARASDSVGRSAPVTPADAGRPSNSRTARPRAEERPDVQPEVWRSPNVQSRTPQAARPMPAPQEAPGERPTYGRRAPQAQPSRPESVSPEREQPRWSPPAPTRRAEPAPRAVPAPARPAPDRTAPARPSGSDGGGSSRPSRVEPGRSSDRSPSQGNGSSGNGRAQPRSR